MALIRTLYKLILTLTSDITTIYTTGHSVTCYIRIPKYGVVNGVVITVTSQIVVITVRFYCIALHCSDETIQRMRQLRDPRSTVDLFYISGYIRSIVIENPAFSVTIAFITRNECAAHEKGEHKKGNAMCWTSAGDSFVYQRSKCI